MINIKEIDINEAVERIESGVLKYRHYAFLKWYARHHSKTIFAAIATILGVSRSTFSNWLNGHQPMPAEIDQILDQMVEKLKERTGYSQS